MTDTLKAMAVATAMVAVGGAGVALYQAEKANEDAAWREVDAGFPLDCACHGSTACFYVLPDGGTAEAPYGLTLGPDYPPFEHFQGCTPKACVELAGFSSWPKDCPKNESKVIHRRR